MRVGVTKRRIMMNLKPTVCLKHEHGVTAQWWNPETNYMILAIFVPLAGGKYALAQVAGPWSGVKQPSDDPNTWEPYIIDGYDTERIYCLTIADIILTCLNGTVGGIKALKSFFQGPVIGFD